jgi:integrase
MFLSKSRHGIYYYRRNGMRKSLDTRIKREAVIKVAEIITGNERNTITVNHAGAEIMINGDSIEHELALVQALTTTTITTKKVKDVLEIFCQEKTADGSWTVKTAAENTRIIEHFIKGIGNVTTAKINHEVLNEYKTGLIGSGRKPTTINKYLSRIGTFCGWMERHGYLEKNFAKGLQVKRTRRAQDERERFTLEEVEILLSNLDPDAKKTWRYWLPILGYYTGARLNELCQLHCCDVQAGGVISFNDDTPDKRLKNEPSRRLVPIHSELIRLGFLEFCDHEGRVFEELTYNSRDGYAKNPSSGATNSDR